VEVDDVTDEREDAVEMGKGHARQGSPVLSHGLAPAGGVSGDARDLAELALERCERASVGEACSRSAPSSRATKAP
jgi:hypothetical protein